MPAELETLVIFTLIVSVPLAGVTGRNCVPLPPRLRKLKSSLLVSADPQYAASHPHGWRAISNSTANGMLSQRFAAKYHASDGTSYLASHAAPAFIANGSPVTAVMQSRNWYGGPGSRAMTRSESKILYGSPNASDGLPLEYAMDARSRRGAGTPCRGAGALCREGVGGGSYSPDSSFSRESPDIRRLMFVISTIGLPSAYMSASARQYGSGR